MNVCPKWGMVASLVAIVIACQPSPKPAPVEGLERYTDPVMGFAISYPENWHVRSAAGESFVVLSSEAALERFIRWDAEGPVAAKIEVTVIPLQGKSIDSVLIERKIFTDEVYSPVEQVSIGGADGRKLGYRFPLRDGSAEGELYIASADGRVATVVELAAFGGTFSAYRTLFDSVLAGLTLAREPLPAQPSAPTQPAPPSQTLRNYVGQGFSIQIPENFRAERTSVPTSLFSVRFVGDRNDCIVQVDVFDASQQQDLRKIVEENRPRYRASESIPVRLSGLEAYYLEYAPAAQIQGRAYFVLAHKRLYRVVITWYKPEEGLYRPVFERVVQSFRLQPQS
ncbi:MAG: hypothetical protein NZ473_03270 [Candidatus Kapabacteria bacterium]|nr:hypothetical protein [Candidatus Kapabacteria bacterium]MCS7169281.1 hypothetical protein [Candidatus Kapabacteria bacterium]MDW7997690.1 hypothetical protein [Bacteroidota bacterium]MDW8224557.1 hypothetical protein [Bacteroidota bacterium]